MIITNLRCWCLAKVSRLKFEVTEPAGQTVIVRAIKKYPHELPVPVLATDYSPTPGLMYTSRKTKYAILKGVICFLKNNTDYSFTFYKKRW